MTKTTGKPARFKLPARIRGKCPAFANLKARLALVDRIADLPGIETVERDNDTFPGRVDIYLRPGSSDRLSSGIPAQLLCGLDRSGVSVSGLSRWERYQVLANGWGKLINDQVCVHLPRDRQEVEIVWSVIQRAYDRMFGPPTPEPGSVLISTWDLPRFSRTSLQ